MKIQASTLKAACIALLVALSAAAHAEPQARVQLWSQPGEPVGMGQTLDYIYTPSNGTVYASARYDIGGLPSVVMFDLGHGALNGQANTSAALQFSTKAIPAAMQTGEYFNVQKFFHEDPGHPGLNVVYQGRACTAITGGYFTVLTVAYSAPDVLSHYSAAFRQDCSTSSGIKSLYGRITYDN